MSWLFFSLCRCSGVIYNANLEEIFEIIDFINWEILEVLLVPWGMFHCDILDMQENDLIFLNIGNPCPKRKLGDQVFLVQTFNDISYYYDVVSASVSTLRGRWSLVSCPPAELSRDTPISIQWCCIGLLGNAFAGIFSAHWERTN